MSGWGPSACLFCATLLQMSGEVFAQQVAASTPAVPPLRAASISPAALPASAPATPLPRVGASGASSAGAASSAPRIPVDAVVTVVRPNPDSPFSSALASIEEVLKVAAYLVGGAWVYFNYFKGRTHRPRLEVSVVCTPLGPSTSRLLKIVAQAKNAGLSKVDVQDEGTGIFVKGFDTGKNQWVILSGHTAFTDVHEWIEPGVTIRDELVVQLPSEFPAYQAELSVNGPKVSYVSRSVTGPSERKEHGEPAATATAAAGCAAGPQGGAGTARDAAQSEAGRGPGEAEGQAAAIPAGSAAGSAVVGDEMSATVGGEEPDKRPDEPPSPVVESNHDPERIRLLEELKKKTNTPPPPPAQGQG